MELNVGKQNFPVVMGGITAEARAYIEDARKKGYVLITIENI